MTGRTALAAWSLGVLVVMGAATVAASRDQGVVAAARDLWVQPWGRATILDAYLAFVAVWLWIAARERRLASRLGWLAAILTTGNFAIATYVLLALRRLPPGASWRDLFAAPRREASP